MLRNLRFLLVLLPIVFLLTACSGEDSVTEKASKQVDMVTTKAADKAVKKIRSPINKAKMTKNLGADRMKAMDEAMKNK